MSINTLQIFFTVIWFVDLGYYLYPTLVNASDLKCRDFIKGAQKRHILQKEFLKKVAKIIPELYIGLLLNIKVKRIT